MQPSCPQLTVAQAAPQLTAVQAAPNSPQSRLPPAHHSPGCISLPRAGVTDELNTLCEKHIFKLLIVKIGCSLT